MDQRDTFDAVADLYGEVRPGYPAALYDELWSLAGLGRDAVVLEVGCGAGQATGDLAARARRVTALDPGPNLIAQARGRVAAANVDYVVARFEDFAPGPQALDLVASAQAWHWVDRAVGFAKAAAALKAGGSLAVFGHVPNTPDGPLASAFKAAYDRFLPGAWGTPPPQAGYRPDGPLSGDVRRKRPVRAHGAPRLDLDLADRSADPGPLPAHRLQLPPRPGSDPVRPVRRPQRGRRGARRGNGHALGDPPLRGAEAFPPLMGRDRPRQRPG